MKIRFRTGVGGNRFSYKPGDEIEVSEEQARRWVKAGHAEYVRTLKPENTRRNKRGERAVRV